MSEGAVNNIQESDGWMDGCMDGRIPQNAEKNSKQSSRILDILPASEMFL